ncbi:hypothetical protein [Diatraea saccharalis granulovirus]|uniref:Uncharacterized protein n=1 Tax=Diatraea saccharalis granulovirus TaxID=1675862 RepID=A0A0R7EZ08_9BBAC|nr:hypothetical protein [Diatraea saccharalis granulovirus]AKN80796.1 hypothetical protein [Diatraea saccharalis granulovirus]
MSSLRELYHEILKTQQDIAITYSRVVGVENELKKKLSEDNRTKNIDERLNELQQQISDMLEMLKEKKDDNDEHKKDEEDKKDDDDEHKKVDDNKKDDKKADDNDEHKKADDNEHKDDVDEHKEHVGEDVVDSINKLQHT